jgi:valyl-tRNA synthetase
MEELPKAYEAAQIEKKWYDFWEKNGLFRADAHSSKPAYTIVLPPPNVTGILHMGHALGTTIQDILIRWKRMSGYEAAWIPGCDHAGIATQTVVERHLMRTLGKRRSDFSRAEFLEHVWTWKEKSEKEILGQFRRVGASCDWSRKRFTMDKEYCHSVRTAFRRLFEEGLIYRGLYLVNWDPVTQTALAEEEVEYEERAGFLWYISYPIVGGGDIIVATTRPETMLGDTACAVNPKDERYKGLIGKKVIVPLAERQIPIIGDDMVDASFGTGVVKVTPAHDHNDYALAQRHSLPCINILEADGKLNSKAGPFAGMRVEEARPLIVEKLKALGKLIKVEPYTNRVGLSYRSKAVIEPYLSEQWFMRMSAFRDMLKALVTEGTTKIIPSHWQATYFHWIDNLRDWCISRQLVWGHQIPIWYHKKNPGTMICYDGEGRPPEVAAEPESWRQDPDVLDTWFSSSLWPFATLGWPKQTADLEKFYPNNVLVTGYDILFFWVTRMLLMGSISMQKAPFPDVFLHGIIYGKSYSRPDGHGGITYASPSERRDFDLGTKPVPKDVSFRWEKMSKSKGNVIDPEEIINEYGADAMRMALTSVATANPQIDLDRRRFEEYKNFANKVWNGARFVFLNIEEVTALEFGQGLNFHLFTLEDKWILSRLARAVIDVNRALESYAFDTATNTAYNFYWNELCAYYVETTKPFLFGKEGTPEVRKNKQKLLTIVLLAAIRLLHPMAPFITEELFSRLKTHFGPLSLSSGADPFTKEAARALESVACIRAPFPEPLSSPDAECETEFAIFTDIIYAARNIRGELKIPTPVATDLYIWSDDPHMTDRIRLHGSIITSLIRIRSLSFTTPPECPGSFARVCGFSLFIPVPQELMKQEEERLQKEEKRLSGQIERLEQQLANPAFCEKAPPAVLEKQRASLEALKKELKALRANLAA